MSGVPEVVKGGFEFSIAGAVLTVAAKGVTKVRFPHASTAGLYVVLDLTGRSYTFDTDSYPVDAGLGITTTVDWGNAMPHFVYLGNEDNTSANVFAFSTRDPRMVVTPAVGLIHDTTALGATADSQNHILSWKADDAGIAAKPCVCIGSHTVTWETDAAPVADVWELVALTTADGFGRFQEGVQFTYPLAQNGAAASSYQSNADNNTCTATMTYIQRRDGSVNLGGYTTWAGAGAATSVVIQPPLNGITNGLNGQTVGYVTPVVIVGSGTGFNINNVSTGLAYTSAGISGVTLYYAGVTYQAF